MAIVPPSGFSSPAMERMVVVLPQPEGPSRVSTEPVGTEKLISSTARTLPPAKVFSRSVTWMDMECSSARGVGDGTGTGWRGPLLLLHAVPAADQPCDDREDRQ